MKRRTRNIYLKNLLVFVLPIMTFTIVISFIIVSYQTKSDISTLKVSEEKTIEQASKTIELTFNSVIDDIRFLKKSSYFQSYISDETSAKDYNYAVDNLMKFMETRKKYYQIRYIDLNGQEKIRIKRSNLDVVNDEKNRQNKSSRYYLKRISELDNNKIYISKMDLNVENGAIERPFKPVTRIMTAVTNNEGKRYGYLVINLDMRSMLARLSGYKNTSGEKIWILKKDNVWALAPNNMEQWVINDDLNEKSLFNSDSLNDILSEIINTGIKSSFIKKDNSVLFYRYIDNVPGLDENQLQNTVVTEDFPWMIMSYISDVNNVSITGDLIKNLILFDTILFVLVLIAAYLITRNEIRAKVSDEALLNEKILLNNLFDNAPFSLYIKDLDGRFENVNSITAKIIGRDIDEIKGKTVDELYTKSISDPITRNDREVILAREAIEYEEVVKDASGNKSYFMSSKFPIYNFESEIVGLGGVSTNITKLKKYEEELNDKEKRFQGIFDNAFQFIKLLDINGKIIEVNHTALDSADIQLDDVVDQYLWNTYWYNYSDDLVKNIKKDILDACNNKPVRKEYSIRVKNEKLINIDLSVRPIYDENNTILYLILEGRDISQSILDKNKLEYNYMMLDAINAFQSGIIDQNNVKDTFNVYLDKIISLTNSEYGFIGEVFHDDKKDPYLKTHAITNIAWNDETRKFYSDNVDDGLEFKNMDTLFGACLITGEAVIANDPVNDPRSSGIPEGHPALNNFLGIPVYFNNVMLGMIGVANRYGGYDSDICADLSPIIQTCGQVLHTYQISKQEKLMEEELTKSERRMRALIDAAPDGLLMIDKEGVIRLINSQVEAMLGYSRHELIGQHIELLVPDNIKKHHPHLRKEFMTNPVVRTMQRTEDLNNIAARHKNGYSIPMEIGLSPLKLDDHTYIIASLRDITERKRMDSQLMQSQKMESVGKLTGGIAHDFNNFLGVIVGNLDLLSHLLKDNVKAKSRVDKATQAALRGAELTKRLLAFSRRQTLAPKPVVVNEIIDEMTEIILRTIGSDIEILKQLDEDIWMCNVDPHQLENVILNMAINARDAMPSGGKFILTTSNRVMTDTSVEVAGGEVLPGKYIMIEITDTGSGIPREEQDKIFEPFYTTKEEGKGTGLGLAMVYGFVKQSSGFIKLYSEFGHGSSFRILLPKVDRATGTDTKVASDLPLDELQGKEKILVVDDEELLLDVTVGQLENAGYDIVSAKNGDDALQKFKEHPDIDMLFTDIIMPGEYNGVRLANLIQEMKPEIKVLLMSGFPKQALDSKNGNSENYSLLNKPYREIEMLTAVRKTLED